MGRYDIITGRTHKDKKFDPVPSNDDLIRVDQTLAKGSSLMIRGPDGYQIHIPVRFIKINPKERNGADYELCLEIPPSVGQALLSDIRAAEKKSHI